MGWQVRGIAAVLLVGLVGSGCSGPAASQPAGSASVGFVCVDDGLRVAGACSRADFEAQQAEQATFAEAKSVYGKFLGERNRLAHEGGADEASELMRQTAADPYLSVIVGFLRDQRSSGRRVEGDLMGRGFSIERSPGTAGPRFRMYVCEDGTGTRAWSSSGQPLSPGRISDSTFEFEQRDGFLKIVNADNEIVKECRR